MQSADTVDEMRRLISGAAKCFENSWGNTLEELDDSASYLAGAIDVAFNPRDDDSSQEAIMADAVLRAAAFIAALPCECGPVEDYDPCARCAVLGRCNDRPMDR